MATRKLTPAEAEQAEKNRKKLLEAEAAGLLLIRRGVKTALTAGLSRRLSNAGLAQQVERGMAEAIVETRRRSTAAGLSRLRAEAAGLGFEIAKGTNVIGTLAARDAQRAAQAANSYARRFWKAAEQSDASKALEATKGSLRRAAVTESSDAFNIGRKEGISKQVGQPGRRELARVWDALLDACPVCAAEDGKIVGVHERFSIGEPGTVHFFCRCSWTLVTLEIDR